MNFNELNLSKASLEAIKAMGFTKMTPIQERSIPLLIKGLDIIGQADTGTGKTLAFAIPAIEKIQIESQEIQILVLCPTRELSCQVAEQFNLLLKTRPGISCLAIYGGQKISSQVKAIKNHPRIIVGTPGRILDHIRQGSLRLRSVTMLILDEADKMLEMGFMEDIETILKQTSKRNQTVLFSATMQPAILDLARQYQKKSQHINLVKKKEQELKIKHLYYELNLEAKYEAIKRLIFTHRIRSGILFCNTRVQVDGLFGKFKDEGFSVANLHGELDQNKRNAVMRKFREGEARLLIATDIAARGIDVDDIDAVFNLNLPRESQDYIHRAGRTGRAGKTGISFSLVTKPELKHLKEIAARHQIKIERGEIPSLKSLEISSLEALQNLLIDSMLSNKSSKKYLKQLNHSLLELGSPEKAVKQFLEEASKKKSHVFGGEL